MKNARGGLVENLTGGSTPLPPSTRTLDMGKSHHLNP